MAGQTIGPSIREAAAAKNFAPQGRFLSGNQNRSQAVGSAYRVSKLNQFQLREILPVSLWVERHKAVRLQECVRADEKVG